MQSASSQKLRESAKVGFKPLFLQTYMGRCTRRSATLQSTPSSINLPRACLQSFSEHLVWSGCPLHSEIQVPLDPTHVCAGSSMCKPSSSVGGTAKKARSTGESCKFAHHYAHSTVQDLSLVLKIVDLAMKAIRKAQNFVNFTVVVHYFSNKLCTSVFSLSSGLQQRIVQYNCYICREIYFMVLVWDCW